MMEISLEMLERGLGELLELNPLVSAALLRVQTVEIGDEVESAAVSVGERPRMLVNPNFVRKHCETESDLQALLFHELMHVQLRHGMDGAPWTKARHLACDAVINALACRILPKSHSDFFARYYRFAQGPMRLLRAPRLEELRDLRPGSRRPLREVQFHGVWRALYRGEVGVADIERILDLPDVSHMSASEREVLGDLLGDHHALAQPLPPSIEETVEAASARSTVIAKWKGGAGQVRAEPMKSRKSPRRKPDPDWCRLALSLLRRHARPEDGRMQKAIEIRKSVLPVLHCGDRRAALRSMWSPILPFSEWPAITKGTAQTTQVYLDVSGSMDPTLGHLVDLLWGVRELIRRPLWAFSTQVHPASFVDGALQAPTTGGTAIRCVLEHIGATKPQAAIIVTDGLVELVDSEWLRSTAGIRIHVLLLPKGDDRRLRAAGIPFTRLPPAEGRPRRR